MTDTWTPSVRARERALYHRSRARRSVAISAVSTVVVVVLFVTGAVNAPGWPRVQAAFFDPAAAWASLPDVLTGLWLNVRVWLAASVLMLVFGTALAVVRTLSGPAWWPLRAAATVYVDLFRGTPVIIVLYLVGFGLPALRLQGIPTSYGILGTAALTLSYSAYVAEVVRAGIESIHPSQRAAARSLGLSHSQTLRHVVLPQAFRNVIPPLLNDVVSLQKDAGLISVLGALDALRYAQIAQSETASFTSYVVAGLLFVLIGVPLIRVTDALARRSGYGASRGALRTAGIL